MNTDWLRDWPRLDTILDELFELAGDERNRRLESLCGGDPALRARIAQLLEADETAGSFLESCPWPGEAGAGSREPDEPRAAAPAPPTKLGPYRVERVLGYGGMGTVYLGRRDDGQFEQVAAIKCLATSVRSPEARERFVRERQILGRLEHTNIARLLEGGVLEDGSPWFAMEYVPGQAITRHCAEGSLGIAGRIELFLDVCRAVEYAHGQLVVHRDIKPANILVSTRGEVKLLDFGIAKLIADEASPGSTRVMTPDYAAPEQVLGGAVSVATDVYLLGVVLYELLTGRRAHDPGDGSPAAWQRAVVEVDPPPPSRAAADPASSRLLAGDLDAIIMKALRKEPGARYASAHALRADLEAYLGSRPVTARRGTAAYRTRKYVRRHRIGVGAGALTAISLAGGLLGVLAQSRVAASERDRARAAQHETLAINDFVVNELLLAATPEKSLGRALTVSEVLDNAARSAAPAFQGQPSREAAIRHTLARSYLALGRLGEARAQAEAARELVERSAGSGSVAELRSRILLGDVATEEGRLDEACGGLQGALDSLGALLPPDSPDRLAAEASLGRALAAKGDWDAGERHLRAAIEGLDRAHPDLRRERIEARRRLADVLTPQYRPHEAEAILREVLALQVETLGPDHPDVVRTIRSLAWALSRQLRFSEALELSKEALARSERLFGPAHPSTGDAVAELSVALDRMNDPAGSEAAARRALEIDRDSLGADHPKSIKALSNLGILLRTRGDLPEAEAVYREVHDRYVRAFGPLDARSIQSLSRLSSLLDAEGKTAMALAAGRRVIDACVEACAAPGVDPGFAGDCADTILDLSPAALQDPALARRLAEGAAAATGRKRFIVLKALGRAEMRCGDKQRALDTLLETLALREAIQSWTTEQLVVDLMHDTGRAADVEPFLAARIEQLRTGRAPDDPLIAKSQRLLALHLAGEGDFGRAEETMRAAIEQLGKTDPEGKWEVGRAESELGGMLLARGAAAEAEPLLLAGWKALDADPRERGGKAHEAARDRLASLYDRTGRASEAARLRSR